MAERRTDLARRSFRARRLRDAALALPLIGGFFFLGPFAALLPFGRKLFGIPIGVLVLFGLWLGLILVARSLARRITAEDDT